MINPRVPLLGDNAAHSLGPLLAQAAQLRAVADAASEEGWAGRREGMRGGRDKGNMTHRAGD